MVGPEMLIIGDVHSKFEEFQRIIWSAGLDDCLQVGDMGFGFCDESKVPTDENMKFIRGNHDSPEPARQHPNYLGDWGYWAEKDLFYVSGALSIDKADRVPGKEWWADEELSREELEKAKEEFWRIKPRVMVTHTAPTQVKNRILKGRGSPLKSWTEVMLQDMFGVHQPKLWIFGHFHTPFSEEINGTRFICLEELATIKI